MTFHPTLDFLKSRHPNLSPLDTLLLIDKLACQAIYDKLLKNTATDQTYFALTLQSLFIQYLKFPGGDRLLDPTFTLDPQSVKDTLTPLGKLFSQQPPKPPNDEFPLYLYVSSYTVLVDMETKGSNKLFWNTLLQTNLIRPKIRQLLTECEREVPNFSEANWG